jgi:hypothetical protein
MGARPSNIVILYYYMLQQIQYPGSAAYSNKNRDEVSHAAPARLTRALEPANAKL